MKNLVSKRIFSILLAAALLLSVLCLGGCEDIMTYTFESLDDYGDFYGDSSSYDDFYNDTEDNDYSYGGYSEDDYIAFDYTGDSSYNENTVVDTDTTVETNETAEALTSMFSDTVVREKGTKIIGNNQDKVTIMIMLNGSNLESDYGCATADLKEILAATDSDNVNIIIQTIGTKKWQVDGISSSTSQRYLVSDGKLSRIESNLGDLDVGNADTLKDFVTYCSKNYPANRNMLIFWNHGGGIIYGYGYDDTSYFSSDTLNVDEIQKALSEAGVYFDFIGFDACIMGGIETACALYDFSDYLIVSEDFESADGWEYTRWLSALGQNSSTPTPDLAKIICDDFVKESKNADSEGILALIDLSYMKLLYSAWTSFAYSAEEELLGNNYSYEMTPYNRVGKENRGSLADLSQYYAVDIMATASSMNTEEAAALSDALSYAIVYMNSTSGDRDMTGLSVTLPYGSSSAYNELSTILKNCGFDSKYIEFLGKFPSQGSTSSYYDWDDYIFGGWDSYDPGYDWSSYDYWGDWTNDFFGWDSWSYDYNDYGYGSYDWGYDDWFGYGDSYSSGYDDWFSYGDYFGYDDWYYVDDWESTADDYYDYFSDWMYW